MSSCLPDASEFKPFKKPPPSGTLTGKTDGSRRSCEVNVSYPAKEGSRTSSDVHFSYPAKSLKNPLQHGGLTDETGAPAGPPAGLTQEQWNLATAYIFHYWSHSTENKVKFPAEAVVFHKHREEQKPPDEEEFLVLQNSYSSEEELSDAEEQLQRLLGEPMSPPNSQALAMPLPPRKKEENQETPRDESTDVVKYLKF